MATRQPGPDVVLTSLYLESQPLLFSRMHEILQRSVETKGIVVSPDYF
jgi:hypothetical protein